MVLVSVLPIWFVALSMITGKVMLHDITPSHPQVNNTL